MKKLSDLQEVILVFLHHEGPRTALEVKDLLYWWTGFESGRPQLTRLRPDDRHLTATWSSHPFSSDGVVFRPGEVSD